MHGNNLRLVLGLGLVRVSSRVRVRIRVKVRVSVMVRVSIKTRWVVNFALFRCYRPVIFSRPAGYTCTRVHGPCSRAVDVDTAREYGCQKMTACSRAVDPGVILESRVHGRETCPVCTARGHG